MQYAHCRLSGYFTSTTVVKQVGQMTQLKNNCDTVKFSISILCHGLMTKSSSQSQNNDYKTQNATLTKYYKIILSMPSINVLFRGYSPDLVADWDICLKRALRSGQRFFGVLRGNFVLTKTKWPLCKIYISYNSI